MFINIIDTDCQSQGLYLIPPGMTTKEAQKVIRRCRDDAIRANPDEWNYDDVAQRLRGLGFTKVPCETWEE